ncbi:MAG: efflux RND transporter permease subunit, partial [Acidobacteriota bacterium]|nr:efflux RND transporter permease subunit [Acidobacteriota bacterium]
LLPREAERPLILHYDPSLDPALELSLSGTGPQFQGSAGQRRLRRLADLRVKRAIEPIDGVAAVRVRGGLEEEIHVLLEEKHLRRTGISIRQVIDRLSQENINLAGGVIEEGRSEFMVRTVGEFADIDQIASTVVAIVDDRVIKLEDLGRVVMSHKDREIFTRTDGGESVQIEIFKDAETNIVALADRVRSELGAVPSRVDAPGRARSALGGGGLAGRLFREEGAELRIVADRSLFIKSSIDEVRNTAVFGGVLATLMLFLFLLNFRTTIIIFFSIPISLLVTFAPLHLSNVTLNVMSLGGLALGIGMLVDNSIVVLESIYRCREEGDETVAAAIRGTNEVRGAVTASTLTTIAVFFPMVFVEGVAGQAFGDLGISVVFSLLVSLAVAVFFIPMLSSREPGAVDAASSGSDGPGQRSSPLARIREHAARKSIGGRASLIFVGAPRFLVTTALELFAKIVLSALTLFTAAAVFALRLAGLAVRIVLWPFSTATNRVMRGLSAAYPVILRQALSHPLVVVLLVALTGFATWAMIGATESELLPEIRQGEFSVEVELPAGTPVEQTDAILAPVERAILAERETLRSLILTVGYDPSRTQAAEGGENTAEFKVLLDPATGRDEEDRLVRRLRQRFGDIPDVEARISRPVLFSFKTPIEVEVHGDELKTLGEFGRRTKEVMQGLPQVADVDLSIKKGAPEVQISYDRDLLASYDLKIGEVARLVRSKVQGSEATKLNLKDRRIPIIVRLTTEDRETLQDIRSIIVNPGGSRPLPLSAVADVSLNEGPSEIRRVDGRRVALLSANIASGSLSSAVAEIDARLRREIEWPAGVSYWITGQNEEWERSRASLLLALGLSIFLVYVIMAAQFESMIHPLVIMFSIPLAFIGSLIALKIAGLNVSVVVFLGAIMLAGIVVNNAIVLVDYVNKLRSRGVETLEAIVTAGRVRLRPIVMTTTTTILGLLPMALGTGHGAELRTPMAVVVIGGLISSTLLTLIVVPTFYLLAGRI